MTHVARGHVINLSVAHFRLRPKCAIEEQQVAIIQPGCQTPGEIQYVRGINQGASRCRVPNAITNRISSPMLGS